MPILHYLCPSCGKFTNITPPETCCNLRGSNPCSFALPCQTGIPTNRFWRDKIAKHTSAASPDCDKLQSWTESPSNYAPFQLTTFKSGSVHFDPCPDNHAANPYLFLFCAPQGPSEIARIKYPGLPDAAASGCIMPLNSTLQKIHHFYDNYLPRFIPIAEGQDIIIQREDDLFKVVQNGELKFKFDSTNKVWSV